MEAIETFEHAGRKVSIYHDEDPVNPCSDYDEVTTLGCWHRRAKLGHKQIVGGITADELIESYSPEEILAILPLYLYEHSGMTMSTGEFSCPFDSSQVGWGYVTKFQAIKMGFKGDEGKAFFEKCIEEDVKTYDLYLTGQCYGFVVTGSDGDELDSCWGFLGDIDYVRREAKSAAESSEDPAVVREAEALSARATYAG